MKILVLGSGGMLGHKMLERLKLHHPYVEGVSRKNFKTATKANFDATDSGKVMQVFNYYKPDVVVNCLGVIKQRTSQGMQSVNALLPHFLSRQCEERGAYLIHFSSDCVFSGKKGMYTEKDAPDAEDLYGLTKAVGEITDSKNTLTLRTSIVGRERANYLGLLEWFLRQTGEIQGHENAIFSGVTTEWLSSLVAELIYWPKRLSGLYNVATEPVSKFELLKIFQRTYNKQGVTIIPVSEPRCDRSLDPTKFKHDTLISIPSIEHMVEGQRNLDKGSGYAI
jgi:dTDP-4-dehydrorhamnose reductase